MSPGREGNCELWSEQPKWAISAGSRAVSAKLGIKAHALMLRHACGYKLANDGVDTRALQAYLGYRNIQNTTPTPR